MSGTTPAPEKPAARAQYDFTGRVAIVTGAAQGIGEAYARALAAAGAAVVVDASDPESARAMATFAVERFGGIDLLVNNAAIYGQMKFDLLLSVDWAYYKQFIGV